MRNLSFLQLNCNQILKLTSAMLFCFPTHANIHFVRETTMTRPNQIIKYRNHFVSASIIPDLTNACVMFFFLRTAFKFSGIQRRKSTRAFFFLGLPSCQSLSGSQQPCRYQPLQFRSSLLVTQIIPHFSGSRTFLHNLLHCCIHQNGS